MITSVANTTNALYAEPSCDVYHCDEKKYSPIRQSRRSRSLGTTNLSFISVISEHYRSDTSSCVVIDASFKTPRLNIERDDLKAITRIREFGNYVDGWDGDEGIAPSEKAIQQAEVFARLLPFDKIYAPHISLASDGEINFLWNLQDFRFDLGFYGDGMYSYYGRTVSGEEFMGDEQPVSATLPDIIIKLIEKNSNGILDK